jgi:hypothetical protein
VTVKPNPRRVNFFGTVASFGLIYNAQKVQLIRKGVGGTLLNVREQTSSIGQTTFPFSLLKPGGAALEKGRDAFG